MLKRDFLKNLAMLSSAAIVGLGADQKSSARPGTFTQMDLRGKTIVEERFTTRATKVSD
jgi:hypothetical protein